MRQRVNVRSLDEAVQRKWYCQGLFVNQYNIFHPLPLPRRLCNWLGFFVSLFVRLPINFLYRLSKSISVVMRREEWCNLGRSRRDRQTFTALPNLDTQISLTGLWEERIHAGTGRTCELHTEAAPQVQTRNAVTSHCTGWWWWWRTASRW